jgi:hypothetical protein
MNSNLQVKSIYPEKQPDYTTWCNMFKVSSRCAKREGILNANRIMSIWDKYDWSNTRVIKDLNTNLCTN